MNLPTRSILDWNIWLILNENMFLINLFIDLLELEGTPPLH